MIDFDHVVKQYGKSNVRAVDDLTLHVGKGQLFGFIGPNGAGKTTTIRLLTGILQPTSGSVTIGGVSMKDDPIAAKRMIAKEGYAKESIDKYLALFELENAAGEQIKSYSRGMKQKLTIIGALVHQPPVWVLDEPMVGLDPRAAHILKEEMRKHCEKGNTVFFSTHVLEVAEKLCDEIAIIDKGRLVAQGTLEALRSGEKGASLEQLFLELTESEEKQA